MPRARRIAAAVAIFVVAFLLMQAWDFAVPSVGGSKYQAVFLANGQTYFGRYTERLGPYAKVEDAFYIQQVRNEDPDVPPEQRLVRRGTEPHQPLRTVLIPKSAILFVEDLRPASPIATFMEARQ